MTKYSITHNEATIEFATFGEASAYKTANSISADIVEIEFEPSSDVFIPQVNARQIRQALVLSGITLSSVEEALASLPEPTKSLAQIEWEYSTIFDRNRQIASNVATLLGWTSEQLDNLWLLAGTL